MLLEGVTMINHLKSKILITGRNFCYLRSPLVARKEKKKIITGYSPPKTGRGGRGGGRESAAAPKWGGGAGVPPLKRPGREQDGSLEAGEQSGEVESQRPGGRCREVGCDQELRVPLSPLLQPGWTPTCGCAWRPPPGRGSWQSAPPPPQ